MIGNLWAPLIFGPYVTKDSGAACLGRGGNGNPRLIVAPQRRLVGTVGGSFGANEDVAGFESVRNRTRGAHMAVEHCISQLIQNFTI